MSQPLNLRARVRQYLRERQRLGFELRSMRYALHSFASYVDLISEIPQQARRNRSEATGARTRATSRRLKIDRMLNRRLKRYWNSAR
jgi:hypothetical protein